MNVTRRNLIAVLLMMAVLFVLIQFSLVVKERENNYTHNDHYSEQPRALSGVFEPRVVASDGDTSGRDYVVYIGSKDTDVYHTVYTWCTYRKINLMVELAPKDYRRDLSHYPKAIIINGEELNLKKDLSVIELWEGGTVPLIFATLPNVKKVQTNKKFMSLIGVDYMINENAIKEKMVGYHVLGDFLLGGEIFYEPATEEEKKRMDLNLDIPRYHVFNNTKSYIIGMYKKTPENTELQPSLLWRYTSKGTNVFVVNGNFIRNLSGVGYLSAIMAQILEYDLYPVANVQEFSLLDFPGLSNENSAYIMDKYSRDQSGLYKDLVWPGLVSVIEESGHVPTCYMAPQMDYNNKINTPIASDLYYYLKQIKERRGEMGISMNLLRGSELEDKIRKDQEYILSSNLSYRFGAIYVPKKDFDDVLKKLKNPGEGAYLSDVRTIITNREDRIFDYTDGGVTTQLITGDLNPYYYSEDIKNIGYETALGYANISFAMSNLIWSGRSEDEWQKVSKVAAANLTTYWDRFRCFDRVTASEADRRIRNFLALDYSWKKMQDRIQVKVGGLNDRAWFIMRLREETVEDVKGGSFQKVEDGIYLIQAEQEQLEIRLGKKKRTGSFVR